MDSSDSLVIAKTIKGTNDVKRAIMHDSAALRLMLINPIYGRGVVFIHPSGFSGKFQVDNCN